MIYDFKFMIYDFLSRFAQTIIRKQIFLIVNS